MALILLLLAPTIMIFFGLQVVSSVPLTFVLFYGWLVAVPFGEMLIMKRNTLSAALRQFGFVLHRKNLFHGIFAGIFFFLAIVLAGYFFHHYLFDKADLENLLGQWNFSGDLMIGLMIVLMFINPFLEEMYWRGYVAEKLAGRWNPRSIIFLTSICYTLYHFLSVIPIFAWPFNLLMIIPVFLAGMIWGYMRSSSGSLVGSIVSHILADVGIMAVYFFFLQ